MRHSGIPANKIAVDFDRLGSPTLVDVTITCIQAWHQIGSDSVGFPDEMDVVFVRLGLG